MSALPLHIWTIILGFRDFDWVSARTNAWDAVGVVSYGLIFALIESTVIFIGAMLLGFFVSTKWEEKKRITLMSAMVIILSLWSIFNQTYFLREMDPPLWLGTFAFQTGRPVVALYALALFLVTLSFSIPAYFILSSDKVVSVIQEGIDRLSLLMTLYLAFDAAALVIVLIRNF
jgi:hypothetical protein